MSEQMDKFIAGIVAERDRLKESHAELLSEAKMLISWIDRIRVATVSTSNNTRQFRDSVRHMRDLIAKAAAIEKAGK